MPTGSERSRPIRVVLVDEQPLVRGGIRAALAGAPDIRVVGEASGGSEAIDVVVETGPDVALVDVQAGGPELTSLISARAPRTKVVVLATVGLDDSMLGALRAGAVGFLTKDVGPGMLADSVRTAAAGESPVSPVIARRLIDEFVVQPQPDPRLERALERLTERERDVMFLVARGLTNAEIGRRLFLGEGTVKTHMTAILGKLGLRNRAQVVVAAYEAGVVRLGQEVGVADPIAA